MKAADINLPEAILDAANGVRLLGTAATDARKRVTALEVELEEARQELGRARVYNEALAAVLRRIADENVEAVVDPGDVLFEVRELLGLDGRTGAREVGDRG